VAAPLRLSLFVLQSVSPVFEQPPLSGTSVRVG
jgi:hypothetical protein